MLIHKRLVPAVVPLILLITLALAFRHGRRYIGALGRVFAPRKLLCIGLAGTLILCMCTNPFYPVGPGGGSSSSDDSDSGDDSGDGPDTWLIDGMLVPELAGLYKKEGSPAEWQLVSDSGIHPNTNTYLADVCDYLDDMGHAGEYLMLLGADITSPSVTMVSGNVGYERTLIIAGLGSGAKTIQAIPGGSLVTVSGGNTLILHRNITLQGLSGGSTAALVTVSAGTLVMEEGSAITEHTSTSNGGGVFVNGGSFTMKGGIISGNTARNGGGVYIDMGGSFVKQRGGGVIEGNTASDLGYQACMEQMVGGASSYQWRNNNVSADESLNNQYPNLEGGWGL